MRNRVIVAAAAVLLASAAAQAQQPRPTAGFIDFSFSATDVDGDAARFQRYLDMRDRGSVEGFRLAADGERWRIQGRARRVGRDDQSMFASFQAPRIKASFAWDQIPYFTSGDTRSPYLAEAAGVFRLDDALQIGAQSGQLALSDIAATARPFDLRSRRHTALFDLVFSPTTALDVKFRLADTRREGSQSTFGSFGFSNVVELSAPLDSRTRDVNADVEWSGSRGMLRMGYDGSWFTNDAKTLVWDNPLKMTDIVSPTGYRDGLAGAQGRMAMAPNNTSHGIVTAGSLKLAARTRVTAHVRTGVLRQNERLLPVTINTAAPDLPLPRESAEAEARTFSANVALSSRPAKFVWFNVRYRTYDFDNRTPVFSSPFLVFDQTLHDTVSTAPASYTRANFDADLSLAPFRSTTFRVGYTRGIDDRTFRIFERTTDSVYRASVDSVWKVFTLRGIVERSQRRGSGFDPHALAEVGEQPELRHYDVADRDRSRVTALVQVTPAKVLALSGSVAIGDDDYANSGFGLRDNTNRAYTFAFDLMPTAKVAAAVSYARERYAALQTSRTSNPGEQFFDATRNWSVDSSDKVETISAGVDLLKVVPRTEIRVGYDYSRSRAAYVYVLPANTTLAPLAQLPTVHNEIRSANGEVRYFLTKQVAIGAVYWYDDYQVEDFASAPKTLGNLATTGSLFLGSVYRPYTASSTSVRLIFLW